MDAAEYGHVEMVKELIKAGADLNYESKVCVSLVDSMFT